MVVTGGKPDHVAPTPLQPGAASIATMPASFRAGKNSMTDCSVAQSADPAGDPDVLAQQRSTRSGNLSGSQHARFSVGLISAALASTSGGGSMFRFRAHASLSASEWQQQLRQQSNDVLHAQRLNMQGNGVLRSFPPTLSTEIPSDIETNPRTARPTAARKAHRTAIRLNWREFMAGGIANRAADCRRF